MSEQEQTATEQDGVLDRLEKVVGNGGSVSIQRDPPTRHQSLPWTCSFETGEWAGYGTGRTLLEAVEDALTDYEQSREAA